MDLIDRDMLLRTRTRVVYRRGAPMGGGKISAIATAIDVQDIRDAPAVDAVKREDVEADMMVLARALWSGAEATETMCKICKHNKVRYDAGETMRIQHAAPIDAADKKYEKHYPLYEWGWNLAECVRVIERAGLPKPGKSSCFFCPSMKKKEIQALWENNPDLFARAVEMERNAAQSLKTVKGLGRNWSWESYHDAVTSQISLFDLFPETMGGCICGAPCGCYDG